MTPDEHFATIADREWRPISTAPRDGRLILLTWMEGGKAQEVWPMRWETDATNWLFAPGVTGMWVLDGGGATWNEADPEGAPTHWAPRHDA